MLIYSLLTEPLSVSPPQSIETGQQFTWVNSNMDVNRPKNRYANVIAYDHSRVVLQPIEGEAGSDYINANFCDGYRKHNAYIATQVLWRWWFTGWR